MKYIFLHDFGGRETGEIHFVAGTVLETDSPGEIESLLDRGIVEMIEEDQPEAVSPLPESTVSLVEKPKKDKKR